MSAPVSVPEQSPAVMAALATIGTADRIRYMFSLADHRIAAMAA